MTEVAPAKTFDRVVSIAVGVTSIVNPGLIVEPRGFDDEGIALPSPYRISQPRRLHFFRKAATISEHLTIAPLIFKKNKRYTGSLKHFKGSCRHQHRVGYAVWQA